MSHFHSSYSRHRRSGYVNHRLDGDKVTSDIKSIDELSLPDAMNSYIPLRSKGATCRVSLLHHTIVAKIPQR
jgi:hypothetical protein